MRALNEKGLSTSSGERPLVKAVAFDMDGLMFETESVYWKSASELLRRRGFEYTQALCDEIMGRPPEYCFRRFIELFGLRETWKELQEEDEDLFIHFLSEGYSTTPGLLELLDELERRSIPRCVCTSSAARVANEVLKKHEVYKRFNFILTCEDVTKGKPDPEVYLKAATRFGVNPSSMLVLEDSAAGRLSAKSAGCPCCLLRAQHNLHMNFDGADAVVERLDAPEVLAFLCS